MKKKDSGFIESLSMKPVQLTREKELRYLKIKRNSGAKEAAGRTDFY